MTQKYKLWIGDQELGPYDRAQIQTAINEGDIDMETFARPENGGSWVRLHELLDHEATVPMSSAPRVAPASQPSSQPASAPKASYRKPLSRAEYLQQLRSNSCYGVLRFVINISAALSGVIILITAAATLIFRSDNNAPAAVIGAGSGVIALILLIAAWQAAHLLVDIADTLLERHARTDI